LICCLPRSGSWLLARGLQQTGLAGRPEEYFWDALRPFYARRWGMHPRWPQERFMRAAMGAGTSVNGVFGAKLHWFQLQQLLPRLRRMSGPDPISPARLMERHFPAPRYIWLVREDKVRQAISYEAALATGEWWKGRMRQRAAPRVTNIDYSGIERLEELLVRHEAQWAHYFSNSGLRPLVVTYEELSCNYASVVRWVLRHLNVELPHGFDVGKPPLEKQSSGRTDAVVQQYLTFQRATRRPGPAPMFGHRPEFHEQLTPA